MNTNHNGRQSLFASHSPTMIARAPSPAPGGGSRPAQGQPKAAAAKPKPVPSPKRRKAAGSSRPTDQLVCRYCGSDDLAPSFRKRRDRRCRACFKRRYGAAAPGAKAKRPRQAKARK